MRFLHRQHFSYIIYLSLLQIYFFLFCITLLIPSYTNRTNKLINKSSIHIATAGAVSPAPSMLTIATAAIFTVGEYRNTTAETVTNELTKKYTSISKIAGRQRGSVTFPSVR